jgi:hypothetical protein
MSNKKQTAVDWLAEQLPLIQQEGLRDIIEEAKEMHKQQIIDSNIAGMEFIAVDPNKYMQDSEQFYKETYGE